MVVEGLMFVGEGFRRIIALPVRVQLSTTILRTMLLSRSTEIPSSPHTSPLRLKLLHHDLIQVLDLTNGYGPSASAPGTATALLQRVLNTALALAIVENRGRLSSLAADHAHTAGCYQLVFGVQGPTNG